MKSIHHLLSLTDSSKGISTPTNYYAIVLSHIVFELGTLHEISLIIPANGRIRAPASSIRGNEFNVVVEK